MQPKTKFWIYPESKDPLPGLQNTHNSSSFCFVFRVLANYMVWYIIRQEIKWLSAPFRNAELRYKEKTTGTTSDKDISKKMC